MDNKPLTQSIIKKIQMAKLLYDLGNDCFKVSENPEKIGAGIILLQDAVEIFLIAVCECLVIPLPDYVDFDKYFVGLKNETKEEVPLKKQMLNLNHQRRNVKHLGFLPHIDDCKDFPSTVKNFFLELSNRYLNTDFDSITLVDLLEDDEVKKLLKQAEIYLKFGNYKECQVNCRKAVYLIFEKHYDIRPFEKKQEISPLAAAFLSSSPYYAKNKSYIEKNVKDPTDYIVLDYDEIEKEMLTYGIAPRDFWNVHHLTPPMYYYKDEKEWVIKDGFINAVYNKENAEYCFRKTIEILLSRQRHLSQTKSVEKMSICKKTKNKKIKVFMKASLNSAVCFEGEGSREIHICAKVRGLDDKKYYYQIWGTTEKEGKDSFVFGYIDEYDVEES